LLAVLLTNFVTRPVVELQHSANRLGAGELEARAPPEGPSEIRSLAHSFNGMAAALATNIRAQRDFLANASHQLRTPITGIKLRLEAIREGGGPTAAQSEKAEAEVDRLDALVGDLLALARAASTESAGTEVDLAGLARRAVERWRRPAEERGKPLHLALHHPPAAWADPGDLDHVLDNLIENALNYSSPGAEVTVEAGRDHLGTYLRVTDSGPGIPPNERDRLFERFYRGSTGRKAGPGTGLGLAIVAELVQRWGGTVGVVDGPGTRIEIRLPGTSTVS
jgi:signal transduction histidine kinase